MLQITPIGISIHFKTMYLVFQDLQTQYLVIGVVFAILVTMQYEFPTQRVLNGTLY